MENLFLVLATAMLSIPAVYRFLRVFNKKNFDTADVCGRFLEILALGYVFTHCVM